MIHDDRRLAELEAASYATKDPTWRYLDVSAVLTERSGVNVLAFPGTDSLANAARDAAAWPTFDRRLGICPFGALQGANELTRLIAASLKRDKPLQPIGHSLGGWLALLVGARLALKGYAVLWPVTWGAPKPGCRKFARVARRVFRGEPRRYHNGNDPVPDAPPREILGVPLVPYRHASPAIAIGRPALDPISCHFLDSYRASMDVALALARTLDLADVARSAIAADDFASALVQMEDLCPPTAAPWPRPASALSA